MLNVRVMNLPTNPATLLVTDSIVLVNNSTGAPVTLSGPIGVTTQVILIKDIGPNAGTYPISYVGTVDGATNPTLIDTDTGFASLLFNAGNIELIG